MRAPRPERLEYHGADPSKVKDSAGRTPRVAMPITGFNPDAQGKLVHARGGTRG
jgi:hypothetical protein